MFTEQMGEYRQWVQAAGALATVFSLTSPILDGTMGLGAGTPTHSMTLRSARTNRARIGSCLGGLLSAWVGQGGGQLGRARAVRELRRAWPAGYIGLVYLVSKSGCVIDSKCVSDGPCAAALCACGRPGRNS